MTIPDLESDTPYMVRVRAFTLKAPAEGEWSDSATATTWNVNLVLTPSRTCESEAATIMATVMSDIPLTDRYGGFFLPYQPYNHQRPPAVKDQDYSGSITNVALSSTTRFSTTEAETADHRWTSSTSIRITDDDNAEREETLRIGFAVAHPDDRTAWSDFPILEAVVTIVDDDTLVTCLEPILDEQGNQVMQPSITVALTFGSICP